MSYNKNRKEVAIIHAVILICTFLLIKKLDIKKHDMSSVTSITVEEPSIEQAIEYSRIEKYLMGERLHQSYKSSTDVVIALAKLDDTLKTLQQGNIVFNAPQSMEIDELKTINLHLSPTKSIEELLLELENKEAIDSARIKITNDMEAKLTGRGLAVEAFLPERQGVSSQKTTEWMWEVTPTRAGKQRLYLTLSIHVMLNGYRVPYTVRTFDRYIDVEVSFKNRISKSFQSIGSFAFDNWEWSWTVIVTPMGLWILRKRNQRKNSRRIPPTP